MHFNHFSKQVILVEGIASAWHDWHVMVKYRERIHDKRFEVFQQHNQNIVSYRASAGIYHGSVLKGFIKIDPEQVIGEVPEQALQFYHDRMTMRIELSPQVMLQYSSMLQFWLPWAVYHVCIVFVGMQFGLNFSI